MYRRMSVPTRTLAAKPVIMPLGNLGHKSKKSNKLGEGKKSRQIASVWNKINRLYHLRAPLSRGSGAIFAGCDQLGR